MYASVPFVATPRCDCDHMSDTKPQAVLVSPFIVLGDLDDSNDSRVLDKFNIKCIIRARDRVVPYAKKSYMEEYVERPHEAQMLHAHRRIQELTIVLDDDNQDDIIHLLDDVVELAASCIKRKIPVLVHCNKGISRSPTIVAAIMIAEQRGNPAHIVQSALDVLQSMRPCVNPSRHMRSQLLMWITHRQSTEHTTSELDTSLTRHHV